MRIPSDRDTYKDTDQIPSKSKCPLKALLNMRKSKKDDTLYNYLDEYRILCIITKMPSENLPHKLLIGYCLFEQKLDCIILIYVSERTTLDWDRMLDIMSFLVRVSYNDEQMKILFMDNHALLFEVKSKEYGEGSGVYWWQRVKKVVVGRRRYGGVMVVEEKDKVELDGKIVKEEEDAVKRIKGEALKEKDDPRAFIFPIGLEGQVNENALADTGSDINTMPYRIYETSGREDMKNVDKGITMINHTQAEAMRILTNVLCQVGVTTLIVKFLILDIPIDRDSPIFVGRGFLRMIGGLVNTSERLFLTFDGFCHQTFRAARSDVMRTA
nr:hypothetical protein [Tanacetum cinerariifolium]